MNVAIITSGYLPVPAVRGGAVENIVEDFIIKNEEYKNAEFEIFSIYDEKAKEVAKKYKYTNFYFIKPNKLILIIDKIIYFFFKNIFCLSQAKYQYKSYTFSLFIIKKHSFQMHTVVK